jgi:hypothetical protein
MLEKRMVSYAKMTDAEIKKYREKSCKEDKKRLEKWKKKHPNGISSSCRTPFDTTHYIPYSMG